MEKAAEYTDYFYRCSPYFTIYTDKELGIPGLVELGWHHSNIARKPMGCHYHRNYIEIIFMVRGNVVYSAGGVNYNLKGSDIFFTPVNIPHYRKTGGMCEFYSYQLNTGDPSFLFLGKNWAESLRNSLGELETGIIRGLDIPKKYLAEMFTLLSSASSDDKYCGVAKLASILHKIIKTRSKTQDSLSADIEKTVNLIRANLYEQINLQSLAKEAGLSLPRFKQKFHEQLGMPPRMFINMQKVEIAKKLLSQGKSVTDIAFHLGFNSSSYFSTVFRKFTTVSPSEFNEE